MKAKVTVELYIDDYVNDDPLTAEEKLRVLRQSLNMMTVSTPPGVPYPKTIMSKAELVTFNFSSL